MKDLHFDTLTKRVHVARNRRGVLAGTAALVTSLLVARRGAVAQGVPPLWPCGPGVDGPQRNCICECTRIGFSTIECQAACLECNWHIDAVCPDADSRGAAVGPPICCADRKPCRRVCGDCPDCEPFPDLL